MRRILLFISTWGLFSTLAAQWNPDPTENNLIVSTAQKGTGSTAAPTAVSDGAGGMFLAWTDGRNSATTGDDVFVTRILADGTIAPGFVAGGNVVCNAPANQSSLSMVDDGAGGVVIAWSDARNNTANSSDIYAQRINAAGTALWTENGVAIASTSVNELGVTMARNSTLEVAMVWRFTGTNTDLAFNFIALSDASKALATDIVISNAANNQTNQQVVADGLGGIIVVFTDGREANNNSAIVAQRYNAGGIKQWAEANLDLRSPSVGLNATAPQLVSDGAGGAVFAWSDLRNGNTDSDIYAQKVDGNGNIEWAANGIQVTGAALNQSNPAIVKSGTNYIIGWNDGQNMPANTDLYAQAFSAAGTPLWNGGSPLGVVTVADQQPLLNNAPVIVEDGLGGATFIWDDRRNTASNIDVYAQHVSAAGNRQWAAEGVAVATRTESVQRDPVAVAGTDNSVIIAWRDSRSGTGTTTAEIYASRLQRDGVLPVNFLDLGAVAQAKQVLVSWTTAQEQQLANYQIERSANGNEFTEAGNVQPRNVTGVQQYNFTDFNPIAGTSFYRIKSVDNDGSFKYSAIVKVQIQVESDNAVLLYPNPATSSLNIQLNRIPAGNYQVRIVDMSGRTIETHKLQKANDTQLFTVPISKLNSGMYKMQIINAQGQTIQVASLMKR